MTLNSTHYVATVKIERVDHVESKRPVGGMIGGSAEPSTKRVVTPLTTIVTRRNELSELLTTVGHHLVHIEDIDAIDPEKGATR